MAKSLVTFCCLGTYKESITKVLRKLGSLHSEPQNSLYMETKRNYQSPKTVVIEVKMNQILCESGINSDE